MFNKLIFGTSARVLATAVLLAATLALPAPLAGLDNARHTYLIYDGGEPVIIHGTAEEDAKFDGLTVAPSRSEAIGDAMLTLEEGRTVVLAAGGVRTELTARNETVDHLLRRADVTPAEDEMVVLDLTGEEIVIEVTDTWEQTWEKVIPTSYTTERVANPGLKRGVEQVKQAGQDGEYVQTFLNVYKDGQLNHTEHVSRSKDTSVTEIIEYGTAVSFVGSSDRIVRVVPYEDGNGGYLVFASGATMPFTSVDTYQATAYCDYGYTATGYYTEPGVVAVDPKVIPYGTRMFIQTPSGSWVYGMATARDCGGAVKGKIIDLWYPDYDTCVQWGRRDITVYFLG